jgi:perosamine synthetase
LIPYGRHHLDESDISAVVEILKGNFLTQGPTVDHFEKAIADYVGAKYAVAVTSGTAALHIAAMALDPDPASAFVTSPITFVASANAGRYVGCNILFADVDPVTINMSPDFLREVFLENSNISAVIPVHFGGLPCDMQAISEIAKAGGAKVIEDASHALGAYYDNGLKVGSCCFSDMTVFSFHPVKTIACGEGGLITTNDDSLYSRLLRLRSHGINKLDDSFIRSDQANTDGVPNPWYYEMQELGFNYRLTDIQSALGLSQFRKLDIFMAKRKQLAIRYDEYFAGLNNFIPAQHNLRESSGNHLYVLEIDFSKLDFSRAEFMSMLRERGIGSQVHYIPVPAHPYYRNYGHDPEQFNNAMAYYSRALTIPLFYDLRESEQDFVINTLQELLG